MVVDAVYGTGVRQCALWTYCHHRATTLRRVDDPAIPAADVAGIAACALSHIGQPYSVVEAVLAKLGWPSAQGPSADALYCSTFAGLVVAEATGFELASDPRWQPLYPSVLAVHSDLSVVPLEWRNV